MKPKRAGRVEGESKSCTVLLECSWPYGTTFPSRDPSEAAAGLRASSFVHGRFVAFPGGSRAFQPNASAGTISPLGCCLFPAASSLFPGCPLRVGAGISWQFARPDVPQIRFVRSSETGGVAPPTLRISRLSSNRRCGAGGVRKCEVISESTLSKFRRSRALARARQTDSPRWSDPTGGGIRSPSEVRSSSRAVSRPTLFELSALSA